MTGAEPMAKWHVVYNFMVERTYEVEAPDEASAIKTARDSGRIVNESEDTSDLEHVEKVG